MKYPSIIVTRFSTRSSGVGPSAFAANNDAKLSTVAGDITAAKNAIKAAGVNPDDFGTLYLTVRANTESKLNSKGEVDIKGTKDTSVDVMIAEMVIEQWNKLGFDFEIKLVNAEQYDEVTSELIQYVDAMVDDMYAPSYTIYDDGSIEALDDLGTENGDSIVVDGVTYTRDRQGNVIVTPIYREYDVIAIDYQMLDTTAFSMLSVFSEKFSGSKLSFDEETLYEAYGHVTGYNSEAYNKLIDEAYEAYKSGDTATLSQKLHEAEKMLLNDMPVVPVIEYRNIVMKSSKLSKVKYSAWGSFDFKSVKLKNWQDYVPSDEE